MNKRRCTSLQLFPGYMNKNEARLNERFNGFSDFCSGTVVSLSSQAETYQVGNFKIVLVQARTSSLRSNVALMRAAIKEAAALKRSGGLDLTICYDALKMGVIGLLLKLIFGTKLVVEVNGEFNSPDLYKFKKGFILTVKKYAYPAIKRFVIRRSDGVKGLYQGQLDMVKMPTGSVVDYFFDHTSIVPGHYRTNPELKILTLGFPAYIKGIDLLISAFKALPESCSNWSMEIIGHYSDEELREMDSMLSDNDKVTISRPIPFSEIPEKIDSCSIYVLASRTEGVPRVLIEAMARGRARIAADVGGVHAVVNDNVDGLLFEKDNVEMLRNKLEQLMVSESERKRLAINGLNRFNNEFTFDVYKQKIKEFYFSVIDGRAENHI